MSRASFALSFVACWGERGVEGSGEGERGEELREAA